MPLPYQPWRAALQPASFGGCGFNVETGGFAAAAGSPMHEYAELDTPLREDMGRKGRRWQITGYCIGPGYLADRDALIAVCDSRGAVHARPPVARRRAGPLRRCNAVEVARRAATVEFELVFVEAGQSPDTSATTDTQAQASSARPPATTRGRDGDAGLAGQTGGGVGGINAGAGSGDHADGATGRHGRLPGRHHAGPSPTGSDRPRRRWAA